MMATAIISGDDAPSASLSSSTGGHVDEKVSVEDSNTPSPSPKRSKIVTNENDNASTVEETNGCAADQKRPSLGKLSMYTKAEEYWSKISADETGMLGGFAHVSDLDIKESAKFVKLLREKYNIGSARALDCGSGIGRITKNLLLTMFDRCDMIDVTRQFIDKSVDYLGADLNARVERKIAMGLQDFEPESGRYDVIWIQWVAGHLTDEDLIRFIHRCQKGLKENGCIVLKENIASSQDRDFDEDDNSYTRSRATILKLLSDARVELLNERKQFGWPRGLYEVRIFAFR